MIIKSVIWPSVELLEFHELDEQDVTVVSIYLWIGLIKMYKGLALSTHDIAVYRTNELQASKTSRSLAKPGT